MLESLRAFDSTQDSLVGLCFYVDGPEDAAAAQPDPCRRPPCRRPPTDGDQQTLTRAWRLPRRPGSFVLVLQGRSSVKPAAAKSPSKASASFMPLARMKAKLV